MRPIARLIACLVGVGGNAMMAAASAPAPDPAEDLVAELAHEPHADGMQVLTALGCWLAPAPSGFAALSALDVMADGQGFAAYFASADADRCQAAEATLQLIQAGDALSCVQAACAVFGPRGPDADLARRQAQQQQLGPDARARWASGDQQWHRLRAHLGAQVLVWARSHLHAQTFLRRPPRPSEFLFLSGEAPGLHEDWAQPLQAAVEAHEGLRASLAVKFGRMEDPFLRFVMEGPPETLHLFAFSAQDPVLPRAVRDLERLALVAHVRYVVIGGTPGDIGIPPSATHLQLHEMDAADLQRLHAALTAWCPIPRDAARGRGPRP